MVSERPLTPDEMEAALRLVGEQRYHHLHPFHKLLHGGQLNRGPPTALLAPQVHEMGDPPAAPAQPNHLARGVGRR